MKIQLLEEIASRKGAITILVTLNKLGRARAGHLIKATNRSAGSQFPVLDKLSKMGLINITEQYGIKLYGLTVRGKIISEQLKELIQ